MVNFSRLDLNLLVTLDVLLVELNVTRAAERLHLSQPSVSVHLAKLRAAFDDPLLLPGPRGMRPTARADELREPLRKALEALGQAVSPATSFEPALATQTWRIAASDYAESTILLPSLSGLRSTAPNTRLAVAHVAPARLAKQAEQGYIDLAFHTVEDAPPELHSRVLFKERYVLTGRTDHPALQEPLSLTQFCELEHAVVSPDGGGFSGVTDKRLAELGVGRRVVLSVPHFLFLTSALATTDLVAMVPARLIRHCPGLSIAEAPFDIPGYEMTMLWHERVHRDPANIWLREHILRSVV
jgi:DNA-binding transcriptional LysR family regulator